MHVPCYWLFAFRALGCLRTALSAVRTACNWLSTFRATGYPYPVQLAAYGVCDRLSVV
ncbi:MAG: hypothetical protein K2J81_06565 [Treponemataceae bacterium]|nr:hypothetical protein [Treponemataceae bacterium]